MFYKRDKWTTFLFSTGFLCLILCRVENNAEEKGREKNAGERGGGKRIKKETKK